MQASVEKFDSTKPEKPVNAPGAPGSDARWTSSAKTAVGTSTSGMSHVWFTIGRGVLNEIYFPDIDKANTRTIRLLVTDGEDFFSDEEQDAHHECVAETPGIPMYTITSTCKSGRYRLTKQIVAEAERDTLLMQVRFECLQASPTLRLFLYIEPHLADQGNGNGAWIGQYKGLPMLLAGRNQAFLASMCTVPWKGMTCGYVGRGDGYDQLKHSKKLTDFYTEASTGNVSLCGEIALPHPTDSTFTVVVALGSGPAETAQIARAASMADFALVKQDYVKGWKDTQKLFLDLQSPAGSKHDLYRISTMVLHTHESARFPGAFVASLSLPWGFARGDKDTGAYHVLWPRDLCETAMGLMAAGSYQAGRRALFYLACTQTPDGGWPQNMWLDGTKHWGAIQMDGIAMPILLADQLRRAGALGNFNAWPMIRKAAAFLAKFGPGSQQDRWEALSGYAVFTMACEIPALLAAADFADDAGEPATAQFLRATADAWNDAIDTLLYVENTHLAQKLGVPGYYLRIAPDKAIVDPDLHSLWLHLENHRMGGGHHHAMNVVSPDALALTRFGLRSADDPRMQATARVIDAELKKDLATGPGWIRSTDDGYGEHADGSPYNGHGIGRCWPLLAGERGHFELAAGNTAAAEDLLRVIASQTSECGMVPEQVWDSADIPKHQLYNGHPAGSGMPLAWAHAEYVKLVRSVGDSKTWDMPQQPVQRYQVEQTTSPFEIWTEHAKRSWITPGKSLRMDFNQPTAITWKLGESAATTQSTDAPVLDLHSVLLALPALWKELNVTYKDAEEKTQTIKMVPRF